MKYSYLMTVFDREPEVLLATIRALSRCDMSDSELIVVNDRSNIKYQWVRACITARINRPFKWIELDDYPAFRLKNGYSNPARAFNEALDAAQGENLVIMSSDVLATPRMIGSLRKAKLGDATWTPMVIDLDSQSQYVGPDRIFPAPFCLAARREDCFAVGGWDEEYLKGLCYEDNDFIGRLMLHVGGFIGDWTVVAYHQSHYQQAYDFENEEIREANMLNMQYTKEKWSAIPFHPEWVAFDCKRKPHESGNVIYEITAKGSLLEDTIAKTTGMVADRVLT